VKQFFVVVMLAVVLLVAAFMAVKLFGGTSAMAGCEGSGC
jgi:hypothetical protein